MLDNRMVVGGPLPEYNDAPPDSGFCEECLKKGFEQDTQYCYEHIDDMDKLIEYVKGCHARTIKALAELNDVTGRLIRALDELKYWREG